MNKIDNEEEPRGLLCDIQRVLNQRYGDGTIYLATDADRAACRIGQSLGLISDQGLITAAGRRFMEQHSSSITGDFVA